MAVNSRRFRLLIPMRLALLFLLAFCFHAQGSVPTPIFVLHAYSQEYPWSKGQHQGFVRALNEDTSRAYSLSVEYLDTKRAGYSSAYADLIGDHLRQKYKGYRPEAVYVTDDNALSFAVSHLGRVFPGMPVFFFALELTESSIMESEAVGLDILTALRRIGISIAIDDFGTGHSSLSRLKQLPISELKIDRSFIRDITEDTDDAAIVQTILALSANLDLRVVAEGVEHAGQEAFLLRHGCQLAQGYYYARPMPEHEFVPLLIDARPFEPAYAEAGAVH